MRSVIVTIELQLKTEHCSYDFEIPCDVPVELLLQHIAQTCNGYRANLKVPTKGGSLYAKRLSRTLRPQETFEDAGIWNGDILSIKF